jgi:hypothetical protein
MLLNRRVWQQQLRDAATSLGIMAASSSGLIGNLDAGTVNRHRALALLKELNLVHCYGDGVMCLKSAALRCGSRLSCLTAIQETRLGQSPTTYEMRCSLLSQGWVIVKGGREATVVS